jgi:hypothetical protein
MKSIPKQIKKNSNITLKAQEDEKRIKKNNSNKLMQAAGAIAQVRENFCGCEKKNIKTMLGFFKKQKIGLDNLII